MNRTNRMDHTPSFLGALLSAAAAVTLAGCGASIAGTTASTATPTPTPTPNVTAAEQAALRLFVADPSLSGRWNPCSNSDNWAACPMSAAVKARLADLISKGYFSDTGACGEDYITGTQNGLNSAPTVLSGVAGGDGSVTVVIQRGPGGPNLTAVMAQQQGTWLASNLASGSGPAASLFSAKPNC